MEIWEVASQLGVEENTSEGGPQLPSSKELNAARVAAAKSGRPQPEPVAGGGIQLVR